MIVITRINNRKRTIVDKSLGGNELESVYPQTAIEDIEKLHKLTMDSLGNSIKKKDAIKMIQEAFED